MKKVLLIGGSGYLGSALHRKINHKYQVTTIDLDWFGRHVGDGNHLSMDFASLRAPQYAEYDWVILLAGHSSVPMCRDNGDSVFRNNIQNFFELIQKLTPKTGLIYASSASLANKKWDATEDYTCPQLTNYYDWSKSVIEQASFLADDLHYYGLRFGTLCGISPNTRGELLINKMTTDAIDKREVHIFNTSSKRSCLTINDACRAIERILEAGESDKSGIYNLASFEGTMQEFGTKIANHLNSTYFFNGTIGGGYSFTISCDKFKESFDFEFDDSLEKVIEEINSPRRFLNVNWGDRNRAIHY
jgi:UDP-glucose 4-epimerase